MDTHQGKKRWIISIGVPDGQAQGGITVEMYRYKTMKIEHMLKKLIYTEVKTKIKSVNAPISCKYFFNRLLKTSESFNPTIKKHLQP